MPEAGDKINRMNWTRLFKGNEILFVIMALPFSSNAQHRKQDDSLLRVASTIVQTINAFDNEKSGKALQTFQVPYEYAPDRKKTPVTIITVGKILRKFTYIGYDESLTDGGNEEYYFDPAGKLICHVTAASERSYGVYLPPYFVVYFKDNDSSNIVLKGQDAQSQLTMGKYYVDYYLSASGVNDYTTFDISKNHSFQLKTLKPLALRQTPSAMAPTVKTLVKGARCYYLDRSPNADAVGAAGKWIWYKVRTPAGVVGWIWGSPTGIKMSTDEED